MHATLNRKNCIKILEFYLESIFKMETVNATRCFKMFRNKLPSKRKKGEKKLLLVIVHTLTATAHSVQNEEKKCLLHNLSKRYTELIPLISYTLCI